MIITVKNIADLIDAEFQGSNPFATINHISIDSRSLQNGTNSLFFALRGQNQDGQNYINELYEKGVRNFVVTKVVSLPGANFVIVKDTTAALQKFASYYRTLFNFPVIGITGSNGKTIVKEWLNFVLSPDFNVIRSPKSYNSQVGVPLSIVAINEKHNLGIFEAGISTTNEMQKLAEIIKPTIGILTNIGSAHNEGFSSLEEKIVEKLKLFESADVLIYRKDVRITSNLNADIKSFSWSFDDQSADIFARQESMSEATSLEITANDSTFKVTIPFQDNASIENAMHCIMTMLYLKYKHEVIQNRISALYPIEMRLQVKNGINNTTIIDDSYSSDYQSLKIALDFLESQKQHNQKTLILSDIFQSGLTDDELYSNVQHLLEANNVSRTFTIGEKISEYKNKFPNSIAYNSTEDFIKDFDSLEFANESILVKGARNFRFEEIVSLLEEKNHETVLEINLNAISHNLNYFRSRIHPKTKLMVMVKAFGYGSGGFEIAKLLEHHNVDYLGVAFADEGIALKNSGIKVPIMVLNPESTSYNSIIQFGLEPEIYSIKGLQSFIKITVKQNLVAYPIHLKLDTGMHRLGFQENDLTLLIDILKSAKSIKVQSILSHLATSDNPDYSEFANTQIALFNRLSKYIVNELQIKPLRHILNSSGIANYPIAQFDMVRLGIGLYSDMGNRDLENVGTLKSIISQVRSIPVGDSVGYGRRFIAARPTKVATIPIGYADGISRHWGNGVGYVLINSEKASIIGSICMDMLMVDVTDIKCSEGDSVIIFGDKPTVEEMANKLNTISYEILTGISQRVKRIYYRE